MPCFRKPLWGLALLAALAGCDSQPTLSIPDVSGTYVAFGGGYTWEIDLDQNAGDLSGTGTLTTDSTSFPLTLEGAYTYPVVGFSLDAAAFDVFSFDGRVTNGGDVLTGTLESAGGFHSELSFQRQ